MVRDETDKETYLGDGLYARFDGEYIVLRAPRGDGREDHVVYLDTGVMRNLCEFSNRIWSFPLMGDEL